MQTPTRLYFYWSVKNNPFQILRKAFGGNVGSYQLIVRLVNQTRRREELHPVEAEGNWWFNVEANSLYRAEIGFYAPNRPFVRIMFSNTVETPRKSPSPRPATESEWAVTSAQFAEILDDSGFSADAFEVALAGDDEKAAEISTRNAFEQLFGGQGSDFRFDFDAEEVRFALLALASGTALENCAVNQRPAVRALQGKRRRLEREQSLAACASISTFSTTKLRTGTNRSAFSGSVVHFPKSITKRIAPKSYAENRAEIYIETFAGQSEKLTES
jgi:hypothetical protein